MSSTLAGSNAILRGPELVDDRELNLLILQHLRNGPCQEAASQLEQDLTARGLLPQRIDYEGNIHPGQYEDLVERHSIAPGRLRALLGLLISSQPLLPGGLQQRSLLKLQKDPCRALPGIGRGPTSALTGLFMREAGILRAGSAAAGKNAAMQMLPDRLSFMRTIRGHKTPVYCVVWDRTGTRFATGSDDRLVKIWSAETGLLLKSCRGHDGEITDFAVSTCNSFVASSSNDCTIRVWHLTGPKTGHPQCILTGHTAPVSFVDFSSSIPAALLSSSFDGTCRIWNVLDAVAPAVVLHPVPQRFGLARQEKAMQLGLAPPSAQPSTYWAESRASTVRSEFDTESQAGGRIPNAASVASGSEGGAAEGTPFALLCCSFSSCGKFVVAGGNDCSSYLWHWNISAGLGSGTCLDLPSTSSSSATRVAFPSLPLPTEVLRLTGHRNDICLVAFNNSSSAVASASKDGHVLVWRQIKQKPGRAVRFEMWMCLKCELDQAAVSNLRQARRRASQVPQVNQVAWTSDDQRILAALSDNTIRVWDASPQGPAREGDPSGGSRMLYILRGHQQQVHVLSAHPVCPHVVMSAGYDGRMVIWDLSGGRVLRTFGTQDRGGTDTDPVQVLDGHFSQDGTSIVLSDTAGQASIYSTGSRQRLAMAQYDQFFASDYAPLVRDSNGNVIDAETQQPPHLMKRQLLVDIVTQPYPDPYQSAFQSGKLREAYNSGSLAGQIVGGGPSMGGNNWMINVPSPPAIMAAYWHAVSEGLSETVIARRVQEAEDRYTANHQASTFPETQHMQAIRRGTNNPPQEPRQFQPLANATQQAPRRAARAPSNPIPPRSPWAPTVVRAGPPPTPAGQIPGPSRTGGYRLDGMPVTGSRPQSRGTAAPSGTNAVGGASNSSGPSSIQQQPIQFDDSSEDDDDYLQDEDEDEDDGFDTSDDEYTVEGSSRRRGQGSRRQRRGVAIGLPETSRDGGRAIRRPARFDSDSDSEEEALQDMDEPPTPEGEPSRRRLRNGKRLREEPVEDRASRRASKNNRRKAKKQRRRRRESDTHEATSREELAYKWLQVTEPPMPSSAYVPQIGDEVVYLKNCHVSHLEAKGDKLTKTPWQQIRCGRAAFRQAEPCRVIGLEYFILMDGPRGTGIHVRLKLSGDDSPLCGKEFVVDLEPDMANECLVFQTRFLKGVLTEWGPGDTCQVFYEDEGLWRAEIVLDKGAEGDVVQELLPWDGVALQDRFQVAWESRDEDYNPVEGFEYNALDSVSPWEMLPDGSTEEQLIQEEIPKLDSLIRERMLRVVSQNLRARANETFHHCPPADANYGGVFYNSRIALPISLTEILARLENMWYRTPEALEGDIDLILANAMEFNGESEISQMAERLVVSLKSELQAAVAAVGTPESGEAGPSGAAGGSPERAAPGSRVRIRIRSSRTDSPGNDPQSSAVAAGIENSSGRTSRSNITLRIPDSATAARAGDVSADVAVEEPVTANRRPSRSSARIRSSEPGSEMEQAVAGEAAGEPRNATRHPVRTSVRIRIPRALETRVDELHGDMMDEDSEDEAQTTPGARNGTRLRVHVPQRARSTRAARHRSGASLAALQVVE